MLTTLKKIQYLLRDPISKSDINFKWNNEKIDTASSKENKFKISNNIPILINFKKSIVDESFYNNLDLDKSLIDDRSQIKKKIKNFLTRSNLNSKKSIKIFKKNLNKNSKILVIGGGNIGSGLQELYQDSSVDLISTDIYPSDKINFISDCHNIPIKDESVDGVIIQAVLEHVIYPNKVINEVIEFLDGKDILGEITVVINGFSKNKDLEFDKSYLKRELHDLIDAGLTLSAASKYLARKNNLKKSTIYNLY